MRMLTNSPKSDIDARYIGETIELARAGNVDAAEKADIAVSRRGGRPDH